MSKVKLPFWKDAEEFEPKVYIEDLAKYEAEEEKAFKANKESELMRVRLDFLRLVLEREEAPKGAAKGPEGRLVLRLTTSQIAEAFWAVWRACQGRGPDPLG